MSQYWCINESGLCPQVVFPSDTITTIDVCGSGFQVLQYDYFTAISADPLPGTDMSTCPLAPVNEFLNKEL